MLQYLTQRPVAVFSIFIGLLVLGVAAGFKLPVSLLPDTDIPQLHVKVSSPDMSARQLENSAVRPLRNQLLQTNGIVKLDSETQDEQATLTLSFPYGTDISSAFLEVNEKVDQVTSQLPPAMSRPIVVKAGVTDIPVFYLNIYHSTDRKGESLLELSDLTRHLLKRRVEQLPEVASVDLSGTVEPVAVISPDVNKLRALNISTQQFSQIIAEANLEPGVILVKDGAYQYNLSLSASLESAEEVEELYLQHNGRLLQLKELVSVKLKEARAKGAYWLDGKPALIMGVRKKSDAQLYALHHEMNVLLQSFKEDYPELKFKLTNDQSSLLLASIENLFSSLFYGALFAVFVLFVFYLEWKVPILVGTIIPVSLILSFIGFYLAEISINTISLAGLLLGIGLMIDNSIIIIDNIRQFQQKGVAIEEACVSGPNEVIRPLVSSALTTCAVFVPLIFLGGLAGTLFFDQAISISIALACSLITAYFLLPTLNRLLAQKNKRLKVADRSSNKLLLFYSRSFASAYRHYHLVTLFVVGALAIAAFSYMQLKIAPFPELSRPGFILDIDWNEPINVEENKSRTLKIIENLPEKILSSAFIGEQQFLMEQSEQSTNQLKLILFTDKVTAMQRNNNTDSVFYRVQKTVEGLRAHYPLAVIEKKPIPNLFDYIFSLENAPLIAHIRPIDPKIKPDFEELSWLVAYLDNNNIPFTFPPYQQQLLLKLHEEKLLLYGVSREAIINKIKATLGQYRLGEIKNSNRAIPLVWGEKPGSFSERLRKISIPAASGKEVPLSYFLEIRLEKTLKTITVHNTEETLDILIPYYSPEMLEKLNQEISKYPSWRVFYSGQFITGISRFRELIVALLLALALLYLILAAQFESLLQPLIVLISVPIGFAGALIALWLGSQNINLISMTGVVVMAGIIVNDAILKVDMINRLLGQHSLEEAIHLAGERRLRPILMTSITTILALLPVFFSGGLGSELQIPLVYSIIGGLILGTLSSLYFVPILYRVWHAVNLFFKRS